MLNQSETICPPNDGQSFAEHLSFVTTDLSDWFDENRRYLGHLDSETGFIECAKQLNLLGEKAHSLLGDLILSRLIAQCGQPLVEGGKFSLDARSLIHIWSLKLDIHPAKVKRLVIAASARVKVPELSNVPITAQWETATGKGESGTPPNENEIRSRLHKMDSLDPSRETSVETARLVKKSEKAGIPRHVLLSHPDPSANGECVLLSGLCRNGEMVDVARVEWLIPRDGLQVEPVKYYRDFITRRIGAQPRDAGTTNGESARGPHKVHAHDSN